MRHLPRRLVVLEGGLLWCQKNDPCSLFFEAQLADVYQLVRSPEVRQRFGKCLAHEPSSDVRAAYKSLARRAARWARTQNIAQHGDFFLVGALFAAAHFVLGTALGAASAVAWLIGGATCGEFSFAFVVCGLGITLLWGSVYALLWLYYQSAPWQTGARLGPPKRAAPTASDGQSALAPPE